MARPSFTSSAIGERYDVVLGALDWLIENPENHTRGALARDALGNVVSPHDSAATCFCVLGRICLDADLKPPEGLGDLEYGSTIGVQYEIVRSYVQALGFDNEQFIHANDNHNSPSESIKELREMVADVREIRS